MRFGAPSEAVIPEVDFVQKATRLALLCAVLLLASYLRMTGLAWDWKVATATIETFRTNSGPQGSRAPVENALLKKRSGVLLGIPPAR